MPGNLFTERFGKTIDRKTNELVIRIQPEESIYMKVGGELGRAATDRTGAGGNSLERSRSAVRGGRSAIRGFSDMPRMVLVTTAWGASQEYVVFCYVSRERCAF